LTLSIATRYTDDRYINGEENATMASTTPALRLARGAIAALAAAAPLLLVVPAVLALPLAIGHAQFHAIMALSVLVPAAVIAWRSRGLSTASAAPILGLLAFAAAQLVESVGGLGYGPDNDRRVNDLVAFHDIGLLLTPLGLAAAVLGGAIGLGALIGRRTGRPMVAIAGTLIVLVVGGFGMAKLIGL
jgi:hypothetical protein